MNACRGRITAADAFGHEDDFSPRPRVAGRGSPARRASHGLAELLALSRADAGRSHTWSCAGCLAAAAHELGVELHELLALGQHLFVEVSGKLLKLFSTLLKFVKGAGAVGKGMFELRASHGYPR